MPTIEGGFLSKPQILERYLKGDLTFDPPLDEYQVQEDAIDIRLGFTFHIPKRWKLTQTGRIQLRLDPLDRDETQSFDTVILEEGQIFELLPDEWVRCQVLQKMGLSGDLMGFVYPRTTMTRDGLSIDATGPVDAYYDGWLTIPIHNNTHQPYILRPGMRVVQLVLAPLSSRPQMVKSRWAGVDAITYSKPERYPEETEIIKSGKLADLPQLRVTEELLKREQG